MSFFASFVIVSVAAMAQPLRDSELRARQRDIFPLPHALSSDDGSVDCSSLSRSQKRKLACRNRRDEWCTEGILALNQLIGEGSCSDLDADAALPPHRNLGQVLCTSRIREAYAAVPPPPASLTPAQAFSCLRGSSTGYSPVPLQGTRVPFNLEQCSLPPPSNCAHPLVDSLAGKPKEEIDDWRNRILKPESAQNEYLHGNDRIRPYLDPGLVRDPKIYSRFFTTARCRLYFVLESWEPILAWYIFRGKEKRKASHNS